MSKSILPEVIAASPNRRRFLKTLGAASAAVGTLSLAGAPEAEAQSGLTANDITVLQFALNVEYLDSEFYTFATTGSSITNFGIAVNGLANAPNPTSGGTVKGAKKVDFSNNLVFTEQIALELAADERAHVKLIREVLGAHAIARPNIDYTALGFGFGNQNEFLKLGRIFEDTGLSAYAGSAYLLSPNLITQASQILGTEAEHAATLRTQIARLNVPTAPPLDSLDRLPPPTGPLDQFLSPDVNTGLVPARTPGQVLYIAYGNKANVKAGGFFPTGVNGVITTSSKPA